MRLGLRTRIARGSVRFPGRVGATNVPTDTGRSLGGPFRRRSGTSGGPNAAEPGFVRPLERSWRHGPRATAPRATALAPPSSGHGPSRDGPGAPAEARRPQSRTIASPPGSRPARSAAKHARVVIGYRSLNSGWAAMTERLWRVSATSRITRRMWRSRCLMRTRRSRAWRSSSLGFGFDHLIYRRTVDHDIGAPEVAGQRNRDLCAPAQPWTDTLMQPFDEPHVSRIAHRRTRRKEADPKVEPECRRSHSDPLHRHPVQLTPLQATDGGVR